MNKTERIQLMAITLATLLVVVGIAYVITLQVPTTTARTSYEVQNFASYHALNQFIRDATGTSSYYSQLSGERQLISAPMVMEDSAKTNDGGTTVDYSQTNVQVAGVDEPDIVKTDGMYLYIVSDNRVIIVKAYPAEEAVIESIITLGENLTIQSIFISGNRLAIFAQSYQNYPILYEYDGLVKGEEQSSSLRPWYDSPDTYVVLYNIELITDPEQVKEVIVAGSYSGARLIGDYIYVITTQYSYSIQDIDENVTIVPRLVVNGESVDIPLSSIYYVDLAEKSSTLTNIVSINMHDDSEEVHVKVFLLGAVQTLYVSQQNIYITYNTWFNYYNYTVMQSFIDQYLIPILPTSIQNQLDTVDSLDIEEYQKQEITSWILQKYIQDSMTDEEKADIVNAVIRDMEKTIIHRISINSGEITYAAQGSVPGYANNQFSFDEYNDILRVSTTIQGSSLWYLIGNSVQMTNLYTLDMDLNIVGSLEDITPDSGEQIYATRFIGDRCYLVTFRQTDPFFVIDLSDPTTPTVLGELKIPGYSTYLHPYDDTHIIGIGRTDRSVKISLFDITDFSNPVELDNYTIENPDENNWWWSDSAALYEHKAFLFDKEKNLLVIPAGNWSKECAYVFDISVENGIDLKGIVSHEYQIENEQPSYYWYYDSANSIQRSLYIDNVLYTVSTNMVKMNDLSTLEELNSVVLVE